MASPGFLAHLHTLDLVYHLRPRRSYDTETHLTQAMLRLILLDEQANKQVHRVWTTNGFGHDV
jgi:hypothetical protein